MNLIQILMALFFVGIVSCKNNPYPTNSLFETLGKKVEKTRQDPLLFLYVPSIMRFVEGEEGVYQIDGTTPSGNNLIEAYGLPVGATFDSETGELRWTPGFSDGNNAANYMSSYREYSIRFQLYDLENPTFFLEKEVGLIVFDTAQAVKIKTDENAEFDEESNYTQYIDIEYEGDDRTSIVSVHSDDLPEGARIREVRNTRYSIVFQPKANFVMATDSKDSGGRFYKDINFDIQAVDARGNVATKIINWRIFDKPKPIEVFYPERINEVGDVHFSIIVVDRNGEMYPKLDARPEPTLDRRRFYITKKIFSHYGSGNENGKWMYFNVHWKNIPSHKRGEVHTLNFKACGHAERDCNNFSIDIRLKEDNRVEALSEGMEEEVVNSTETHPDLQETNPTGKPKGFSL